MINTYRHFRQRIFRKRAEDSLPHNITHQRIYIVPTKRGFAFLFALLLMLIASVNYALSLGYALSFLLTGLFAATLLHTYRNVAGIRVLQCEAGDAFAGQEVTFNLLLSNHRTQARHGIRITTNTGVINRLRLEPESSDVAKLKLTSTQRGVLRLGRLTIQSDWPLGLWTCWSYLHAPVQALVYPAPEDNAPPLPSLLQEAGHDQQKPGRQGDVSGLRDYIPGDSIGSIAWKSAARGLGLQVRSFDTESGTAQATLSLQHTGKATLEEQLSRLCAWVLQAESTNTDYALDLPALRLENSHGTAQRSHALKALALHGKLP